MKSNMNYGLYLVTDQNALKGRELMAVLEEAIQGGVSIIQLREKETSSLGFYEIACSVRQLTLRYQIPLIINDRLDIALAVEADGVHLGQEDLPAKVARKLLGSDKILGVSAGTLGEALQAQNEGADYIGVGALYPTQTKSNTRKITLGQIKEIKDKLEIPVIGIGGINESNAEEVMATGIAGIAVASAILSGDSVKNAAAKLHQICFTR